MPPIKFFSARRRQSKSSQEFNFDTIYADIQQLVKQGKFDDALQKGELIEQTKKIKHEDMVAYQIIKSLALNKKGEPKTGLVLAQDMLKEAEKIGTPLLIVDATISAVEGMRRLGMQKECLEIIQKSEPILESMQSSQPTAYIEKKAVLKNLKGIVDWLVGELVEAGRSFQESLTMREKLGDQRDIAICLNNIGTIYTYTGDLDLALETHQKALDIRQKLGNPLDIGSSLGNIADVYGYKGNFNTALNYYLQGKEKFEEAGDKFFIANTLYMMITLLTDNNKSTDAIPYLDELKQINDAEENKLIDQRYRITNALILKASNRLIKKFKAADIFKEISEEDIVDHEITVQATLNLCDLLLVELRLSGNEETLIEVKDLTSKLTDIAKSQNSFALAIQAYLLQSKLALIDFDVDKANKLLIQAQGIAEEKDLTHLAFKISAELDALLSQTEKWEALINRNASIIERLELTQLEETIKGMIKKQEEYRLTEITQEDPVTVLILANNGISLYSYRFQSGAQFDDQIVGAFISAINTFSQEVFAASGSIERIKHADYTLITKSIGQLVFCYAFKGQSYFAVKKFNTYISLVQYDTKTWNMLQESLITAEGLDDEIKSNLTSAVDEAFLHTKTEQLLTNQ